MNQFIVISIMIYIYYKLVSMAYAHVKLACHQLEYCLMHPVTLIGMTSYVRLIHSVISNRIYAIYDHIQCPVWYAEHCYVD